LTTDTRKIHFDKKLWTNTVKRGVLSTYIYQWIINYNYGKLFVDTKEILFKRWIKCIYMILMDTDVGRI